MTTTRTNGGWTRIASEHLLGLGLRRYQGGDEADALWVWEVRSGCGPALARIVDVSASDLKKARDILDHQIGMLESDGGRKQASAQGGGADA